MSIHIIYRDPLNCQLDDERQQDVIMKFSNAGLEVAAIRSIFVDDAFDVQIVLFGDNVDAAREIVVALADESYRDEIFLEYLPDEEDNTEVRPI